MAENVVEPGPPSAKRPKLSSPALSVSASDGTEGYLKTAFLIQIDNRLQERTAKTKIHSASLWHMAYRDSYLLRN